MSEQFTNILVKAPNWVGDALLSTPALTSLGRAFPKAQISVLASPWVAPLLENNPAVNRILIYDPKGEHQSWKDRLKIIKQLRNLHFDLAILFPNSLHSALIAFLSKIPQRLGYSTDGRGILLTRHIPRTPASKQQHQAEYYLALIRTLGVEILPQDKQLVLELTKKEKEWAQDYLKGQDIDASCPLIAIHPGAVKSGKRWPGKRFADVGKELIERYRAHLLFLGSKNEQGLLEEIKCHISFPDQTIVCGIELRKVAALLECCQLFIGNDSGLMHLAAAVKTPIVVIFGPGTPQTTAPYTQNTPYIVILKEFSCRPCRQRFFQECQPSPEGAPPCLDAVTVEDVLLGVESLLKHKQ